MKTIKRRHIAVADDPKTLTDELHNEGLDLTSVCRGEPQIYKICGYASCFKNVDSQNEHVQGGAFAATIDLIAEKLAHPVKLLWQHKASAPIGLVTKMVEKEYGLWIVAEINLSTRQGREAACLIENKIVTHLSIGYTPLEIEQICDNSGGESRHIRRIISCRLWEVSVVTFAANSNAVIVYPDSQLPEGLRKEDFDAFADDKSLNAKKSRTPRISLDELEHVGPLNRLTKDIKEQTLERGEAQVVAPRFPSYENKMIEYSERPSHLTEKRVASRTAPEPEKKVDSPKKR